MFTVLKLAGAVGSFLNIEALTQSYALRVLTGMFCVAFYCAALVLYAVCFRTSRTAAAIEEQEPRTVQAMYKKSDYIEERRRLFGIDDEDDRFVSEQAAREAELFNDEPPQDDDENNDCENDAAGDVPGEDLSE